MSVDSYDYENRLTKVTAPDATLSFNYCSCPTLTGIDSTYGDCGACGPSGKRISKTVNDKTIYTICFDPTMDLDVNGNIIARYVQNPNVLDEPISIEISTGTYYYLFDGLGSVTGLTDIGGNLVATYKYDAFGNILSETGDTTLNSINPYRFTSRVYDKESGLYYYRARYYDSKTGRFMQKDPLMEVMKKGKNLYVYVEDNPVNFVDPSGCWGWSWSWSWSWVCPRSYKLWSDQISWCYIGDRYNAGNDKWCHCFISGYYVRYYYYNAWTVYAGGYAWEVIGSLVGGTYDSADLDADYYGAFTASTNYCDSVAKRCFNKYPSKPSGWWWV